MSILTLFTSAFIMNLADASMPKEDGHTVTIRTGRHTGFLRIVFEGHEAVISKGQVTQKDKNVIVNFAGMHYSVNKVELPLPFTVDDNGITLSLESAGKIKFFTLYNPVRLVIDVYHDKADAKKQANSSGTPAMKKKGSDPAGRTRAAVQEEHPAIEQTKRHEATTERIKEEADFIPEKFKKLWSLLKSGNSFGVLRILPEYKPADTESLAAYHYIYAKAYENLKHYFPAIEHLRLAYIYASDEELKGMTLIKRADLYLKVKFFYEARASYLIFIRDYASSHSIERAHLGLANSLFAIGRHGEAVEHYKKGGEKPEALFGRANALQKLERISEAKTAYERAMHADKTYLEKSPETSFLLGENMRMSGERINAKRQFSSIESGPFQNHATISLGLIALEESDIEEAIQRFKTASRSRDERIRGEALFHLSLAYIRDGRMNDSITSLEEIREEHIDSRLYKDAILILSKLYKKEGRVKESTSLLKELVYGKQPPGEVFRELEEIVLETGTATDRYAENNIQLGELWNEVGQWLIDETREHFLLEVAGRLRHEGKPFIQLCTWLVDNASQEVRIQAAIDLADYYIAIADINMSRKYLAIARSSNESGDAVLRLEAKILGAEGDHEGALMKIMQINNFEENDLHQLGNSISGMQKPESEVVQEAIALYEKILRESDWDAEHYMKLADILYKGSHRNRALKYYRIAYQRNPDDEWAAYRVGHGIGMPQAKDVFNKLQKGDTLLSRMAKTKLMEMDLLGKVEEVY